MTRNALGFAASSGAQPHQRFDLLIIIFDIGFAVLYNTQRLIFQIVQISVPSLHVYAHIFNDLLPPALINTLLS